MRPPERDAGYGGGRELPFLRQGVLASRADDDRIVGRLAPQPTSASGERLDEKIGYRWAILSATDPESLLSKESLARWQALDTRLLPIEPGAWPPTGLSELLADKSAVVLRPDRIVFGVADDRTSLDELTTQLASHLGR